MLKTEYLTTLIIVLMFSASLSAVAAQPRGPIGDSPWRPRLDEQSPEFIHRFERQIEVYIKFRVVLSSVNMVLYGYLMYMYTLLYHETKSRFSLGLIALSSVLLVYSFTSNPLFYLLLRGSQPVWHNVFNVVPDFLASISAFIMIYLTRT